MMDSDTRTNDTHPDAERVQIELLRAAGPARRFRLACSLSATTIGLSRGAIQKANPNASEQEVRLRFVELQYGRELANGLRRYLAAQR